jgi:hypothetical protein
MNAAPVFLMEIRMAYIITPMLLLSMDVTTPCSNLQFWLRAEMTVFSLCVISGEKRWDKLAMDILHQLEAMTKTQVKVCC